jgi:hypothetical protein
VLRGERHRLLKLSLGSPPTTLWRGHWLFGHDFAFEYISKPYVLILLHIIRCELSC